MTAAMNGSINCSIPDGWVPEFAKHGHNAFVIQPADDSLSPEEKDKREALNLFNLLEHEITPTYYDQPDKWLSIVKAGMREVAPYFDAGRMADEYYEKLYNFKYEPAAEASHKHLVNYTS